MASLPLFIARHLAMRPPGRPRTSPGIPIAVAGIALAYVVMLLSIAIVSGFKHRIRQKVEGFSSQITLTAPADEPMALSPALDSLLHASLPPEAAIVAAAASPAILRTDSAFTGLALRSVADTAFVASTLTDGTLPADPSQTLISRSTAHTLGAPLGSRIYACFVTPERIITRRLTVCGIYDSGFLDFDQAVAYVTLPFLQRLAHTPPSHAAMLEINGLPSAAIAPAAQALEGSLTRAAALGDVPQLTVDNVTRSGALYLNWLALLDTNVAVILVLMGAVAAFTLVSSTFIIVLERVTMIGVLKALGMPDASIRAIFSWMGLRLVGLGLFLGNVAGLALIGVQALWHVVPLDPATYFLDSVPVELQWWWWLLLNASVVAIAAVVLLIPTRAVCRISPAAVLKAD